jgi:hypothetical protein
MWAILSGIQGNLTAYQAVIEDITKQDRPIEDIYILGDVIGISPDNQSLVDQIRENQNNFNLHVCRGWWEEQCLILHSLHSSADPTELLEEYGVESAKKLWDSIPREIVPWLQSLDFGFVEFDALLIHGSSVNVSENLTPDTSPWLILDRFVRMNVNYMFSGRSYQSFEYELETGLLESRVATLDGVNPPQINEVQKKTLIGVGSVGTKPHQADYVLYNPHTQTLQFQTVNY